MMLRRMLLGRAAVLVLVSAAVWLVACGGSPKPTRTAPGGRSAHSAHAPHAPPAASAAPKKPEIIESHARTTAEHHQEFISGCSRKATNSPEFCECAWGEFRKTFTEEQLTAGDLPAAKVEKVKAQVLGACSSKINEETVKEGFARACTAKHPETKPYCDCMWTELRKKLSPAELADDDTVASDRFLAARGAVVKTCGAKMPESVSKEAFMKGCAKEQAPDKFCDCAWKELRKQASPGEIESGTFDQKTVFVQLEKNCGKLRSATK